MITKKTLTGIVLAGALAFGGEGCDVESNDQAPTKSSTKYHLTNDQPTPNQAATREPEYKTESISGKIIDVDEDSFPVWTGVIDRGGAAAAAGANYQFEIIRVQDGAGNVKKLLSPRPTSYLIGDNVTFNYMQRESIAFSEIYRDYGEHKGVRSEVFQNGLITIDGVLQ